MKMPFSKRKKRPEISSPTNFEHRVHSGFDHNQGVFIGLPTQWNSIINETDQFKLHHNLNTINHLGTAAVSSPNGISLTPTDANSILSNSTKNFRPKPIVDPSRITSNELTCFKVNYLLNNSSHYIFF